VGVNFENIFLGPVERMNCRIEFENIFKIYKHFIGFFPLFFVLLLLFIPVSQPPPSKSTQ